MWIGLMDKVLKDKLCQFVTWLRSLPITLPFGPRDNAMISRRYPRTSICRNDFVVSTLAPGGTDFRDQAGGGETFHERQDANLGADGSEDSALAGIQGLGSVVTTLDIDVGLHGGEKTVRAFLGENDDGVDAGEGGEDGGPLPLRDEGSVWAFELLNGTVTIQAHDKEITEFFGALQIAHMAEVDQVEAPVGGDDPVALAASQGAPFSYFR
jgi:hypothetical protein